jgi:hypothetical protein
MYFVGSDGDQTLVKKLDKGARLLPAPDADGASVAILRPSMLSCPFVRDGSNCGQRPGLRLSPARPSLQASRRAVSRVDGADRPPCWWVARRGLAILGTLVQRAPPAPRRPDRRDGSVAPATQWHGFRGPVLHCDEEERFIVSRTNSVEWAPGRHHRCNSIRTRRPHPR